MGKNPDLKMRSGFFGGRGGPIASLAVGLVGDQAGQVGITVDVAGGPVVSDACGPVASRGLPPFGEFTDQCKAHKPGYIRLPT